MSSNGNGYHANGNGTVHTVIGEELGPKLPPHNLEAEQGVIGSILLDESRLAEVRQIIGASDFYRDAHQVFFRAICDLADRAVPIDCVTLADELIRREEFDRIGGDDALEEITSATPHAANAGYYAGIVRQKAKMRALIEQAESMLRSAYTQSETAESMLLKAGDRISQIGLDREEEPEVRGLRPWPDAPPAALFHGIAGEVIRLIAPHTESDPIAILAQFLVCFGNVIGRRAHWRVEQTKHYCNLFLCVVGNSSKARKGTSWDHVRWLFNRCDDGWTSSRITSGLSSGEGLIWEVRDPVIRREKVNQNSRLVGMPAYQDVEVDSGVDDKRALFVESEFGSTLGVMSREGNSLSGTLRQAWDTDYLKAATKNSQTRATGAHISVIGHVTSEELHRRLSQTDAANGFANRFIWLCAKRSKFLPQGGKIHQVNFTDLVNELRRAVEAGAAMDPDVPMLRNAAANELWEEVYAVLSEPKPGLLGSVTSRAEAQTMRLAAIYALLDCSCYIQRHHLEAALALWRYSEQSAAYIFGDHLGDPDAERLLKCLREALPGGMTLTQIRRVVFRGHPKGDEMGEKLGLLARSGLAVMETDTTTRKPTVVWKAVQRSESVTES